MIYRNLISLPFSLFPIPQPTKSCTFFGERNLFHPASCENSENAKQDKSCVSSQFITHEYLHSFVCLHCVDQLFLKCTHTPDLTRGHTRQQYAINVNLIKQYVHVALMLLCYYFQALWLSSWMTWLNYLILEWSLAVSSFPLWKWERLQHTQEKRKKCCYQNKHIHHRGNMLNWSNVENASESCHTKDGWRGRRKERCKWRRRGRLLGAINF